MYKRQAVRSYLVLAATILCVVLFDWWGQSQLTEIAQQGAALSQQMSEAVRREDWAQAEPLLAQLEDCFDEHAPMPVSYTHLDVYKRQVAA